jgi:hypothetical protein
MVSRLQRLIAATLAALLVVAVAFGAAHATTHGADSDCAVCVVSHHAPALAASNVQAPTLPLHVETIAVVACEPTVAAVRVPSGSRAPPRTPSPSTLRDA